MHLPSTWLTVRVKKMLGHKKVPFMEYGKGISIEAKASQVVPDLS